MKNKLKKTVALLTAVSIILCSLIVVSAEDPATTPYTKHTIPGRVIAVDFDNGGEGVACSGIGVAGMDAVTTKLEYRTDAVMEYEMYDVGPCLRWMAPEWMKYTVTVEKTATYDINLLCAAPLNNNRVAVSVDGGEKVTFVPEMTADWQTVENHLMGRIHLTEGTHVLTFTLEYGGAIVYGFEFEEYDPKIPTNFKREEGAYRYVSVPGIIEAENYDMGESGSFSTDGINNGTYQATGYRAEDPIDIGTGQTSSGTYNIVIFKGDWVKYTFNVAQDSAYTIKMFGRGEGEVYIDGIETPLPFEDIDYSAVADVENVWLDKGEHTIMLKTPSNLSLDYIQLVTTNKHGLTAEEIKNYKPAKKVEVDKDAVYMDIYVSPDGSDDGDGTKENPYATMGKAKEAATAASDNMTGNIIVHMLPGYYQLDEVERFTEANGGKNGYSIIFRGESKTEPTIISGGTKIEGWEPTSGGYIWKAPAPIEDTRTLFVNGYPAQRAVSKYLYTVIENFEGPYDEAEAKSTNGLSAGFKTSSANLIDFEHPEDLEMVAQLLWTHRRVPIENIYPDPEDKSKMIFEMESDAWDRHRGNGNLGVRLIARNQVGTAVNFHLENALELLDEPGEFFFDKREKCMYYYPYVQEDMTTADVYAGTTEMMVRVEGSSSKSRVENITFENLEFRYGAWNQVSKDGLCQDQSNVLSVENSREQNNNDQAPAQFEVRFAKNINILDCKFIGLGSDAIGMVDGVMDSSIKGNLIRDISGSGIVIDHFKHGEASRKGVLPADCERCDNIEVANNVIWRAGREFRGMPAVTIFMPSNLNFHNNDLYRCPYSGVSFGWGWGAANPVDTAGNKVNNNRIEDVTSIDPDGAHIYTLDLLNHGEISGNYLIKAGDWRGGIYLDEGTRCVSATYNVVEDSSRWMFARTGVRAKWNYSANNFFDDASVGSHGTEVFTNFDDIQAGIVGNTPIKFTDTMERIYPQGALDIIAKAGVEDEYKHLVEEAKLPAWRTDMLDYEPKAVYSTDGIAWKEAEDWIQGAGQNSAYYCIESDVPIIYGHALGEVQSGEWVRYHVYIEEDAEYTMQVIGQNGHPEDYPDAKTRVLIDEKLVVDDLEFKRTGPDWGKATFENVDIGTVYLEEGLHVVHIEFVDEGYALDKFRFFNPNVASAQKPYDEGVMVKQGGAFADIVDHWAEAEVTYLTGKGIINGVSETSFAPEDTLSLYQAVWLASRCAEITYTDERCWKEVAEENGFMASTATDRPITREEFAKIVMTAYKLKVDGEVAEAELNFNDKAQISAEYLKSIAETVSLRFIEGNPDGSFKPKSNLTRAEAAAVIYRLYNAL